MSESVTVRPAKASESAFLSELGMRSKAFWGYSESFMTACREELLVSAQDISQSSREYVVCEVTGTVVGYFAIEPTSNTEYELEGLFVEPRYIGCGYGRILIEEAKNLASKRGAKSLLVQGDPHAEKFYLAAGGVRIGERESESIPGRFLPEFRIILADENSTV